MEQGALRLAQETSEWWFPLRHELGFESRFMKPGKVFLDIGAHVGTWSLRLAHFYDRIFAFEPDPRTFRALVKNLELNDVKNVTPVNCALSNANGIATLHVSANPGISSLTHPILTLFDFPVATLRLDDLVEQQRFEEVSFIKIDTEGAESIIVEGGIETFKRFKPDFYIEVHTPENFAKCRKLLDFLSWDYDDSNPDARPFMVRCVAR